MEWTREISQALLKPFPDEMIEVREGKFFYVDARAVQSRLDEVVGPGNWAFDFDVLHAEQGGVVIKGSLTIAGVTKCDAGEHWRASDRDKIETYKAAVSDSLKRCAVHFGIGRYLYELEVARAGKMTEAEKTAAARKVGYAPADPPPPMGYPCEVCNVEVDPQIAGASRRKFNGRTFCVIHGRELAEGMKAQGATYCKDCGQIVNDKVASAGLQSLGFIRCVDCQRAAKAKEGATVGAA